MAVTTCTVQGNIADLSGNTLTYSSGNSQVRSLYLVSNVLAGKNLVDVAGNKYRVNDLHVKVNPDGSFTILNVVRSDSTGLNIASGTLQYQLQSRGAHPFTSSWLTFDATNVVSGVVNAASAEAAQALPPTVVSLAITAVNAAGSSQVAAVNTAGATQVAAATAQAQAAAASAAIAGNYADVHSTDTAVKALVADPSTQTSAALLATFAPSGREDEPTGSFWLSNRPRHLHVAPGAGARRTVLSAVGSEQAVQEPSLFFAQGQWWMTHTAGWDSPGIYLKSGPTPIGPWTDHGRIFGAGFSGGPAGDVYHSNAFVDEANGTVYLYFTNGPSDTLYVGVASLSNPTSWATNSRTYPLPSGSTLWGNTCIIKEGSSYTMFFETFRGNWIIGYGSLGNSPTGPLTIAQPQLNDLKITGDGSAGNPKVFTDDDGYVMYFHGAVSGSLPTDIYRATSTDKVTWTLDNARQPVLPRLLLNEVDQVADVEIVQTEVGDWWAVYSALDNLAAHAYINAVPLLASLLRYDNVADAFQLVEASTDRRQTGPQMKTLTADKSTATGSYSDVGLQIDFVPTSNRAFVTLEACVTQVQDPGETFFQIYTPNGTPQTKRVGKIVGTASAAKSTSRTVLFSGLVPGVPMQFVVQWKVGGGQSYCRPTTQPDQEFMTIRVVDAGQPISPFND